MKLYLSLALVTALFFATDRNSFSQTQLSETTFDPATCELFSLPDGDSGPPASASFDQVTTGGNPGSYIDVTVGPPASDPESNDGGYNTYSITSGVLFSGVTYNPSIQGAISSISYSFDAQSVSGDGAFVALFFEQNDNYYLWSEAYSVSYNLTTWYPNWRTYTGATSNFALFEMQGDQNVGGFVVGWDASGAPTQTEPDFSSSGAPIEFGIGVDEGTNAGPDTFGIDNYVLTLDTVAAPEPTTGPLLLVAMGSLLGFPMRKRLMQNLGRGLSLL